MNSTQTNISTSFTIMGVLLLFAFTTAALAQDSAEKNTSSIKLGVPFTDGAVLQQQIPVPIWGWSQPGTTITVEFAGQSKRTVAGKNGKWMLKLDKLEASCEPCEIVIRDNTEKQVVLKNILVGEVWLCSGQSNMAAKVRHNHANQDPNDNLLESNFPEIRHMCAPGGWQPATPQFVGEFTRVGFCFARKVHLEQKIPVGLVNACVGGSRIESWMRIPPAELPPAESERKIQYGGLYHERITPLVGYGIRGALWYQGEANANEGHSYFLKMESLINDWRSTWKQGDFPFYFVQLAGIGSSPTDNPAMGDGRARIREAQRRALTINNTGMAVAVDIGGDKEHPANKVEVGERLAHWALYNDYGRKDILPSGPLYKSIKIEGSTIRITFDYSEGLMLASKENYIPPVPTPNAKMPWLSIQDKEGTWHWADGKIEGNNLIVSCKSVKNPMAVRYAYTNRPLGIYLYNAAGLPASPFTTEINEHEK